jgi:hypothetical protein
MNSKLNELHDKISALSQQIKEQFNDALKEASNELFDKYPKLKSFNWVQYTPYSNDGETCEFSIHNDPGYVYGEFECRHYDSAIKAEWNSKQMAYGPSSLDEEAQSEFGSIAEAEELESALSSFISTLNPFETHVRSVIGEGLVTVSREGIEVEDYDHD